MKQISSIFITCCKNSNKVIDKPNSSAIHFHALMATSHRKTCRITGLFWEGSTESIPSKIVSNTELWWFHDLTWTGCWTNIRNTGHLRGLYAHVMSLQCCSSYVIFCLSKVRNYISVIISQTNSCKHVHRIQIQKNKGQIWNRTNLTTSIFCCSETFVFGSWSFSHLFAKLCYKCKQKM